MESPDLRTRVLAAVAGIPAPTRRDLLRRQARLIVAGIAAALGLFWLAGGVRLTGRPPSVVGWTALGTACFTGAGMWFLFRRGRSGLRRGWAALAFATVISAAAFVLWRHGLGDLYQLTGPWPERTGYRCFAMSVATGGILLGAALLAWRRVDPVTPGLTGAAFGAGAGLGSALLVDLWCPVFYVPHLLIGHVLPIAALAAAGAVLGARMLGTGWRAAREPSARERSA